MDATLSDEQEMLAETVERLATHLGHGSVAELEAADPAAGSAEVAATGFLGLAIPESLGGSGATAVEVALVAEAFGRHLVPAPFVGPVLAAELLAAGGDDWFLPQALAGEAPVTLALDPTLVSLTGVGNEAVAWDAAGATAAVGAVRASGGWRAVVRRYEPSDTLCVDVTRRLSRMPADGPASAVGRSFSDERLTRWHAFALSILCADMVGVMDGALRMAVEYAKVRVQFAQPIGSFQAIQHLCAEQLVSLEAARSATYYSAWAVGGPDIHEAISAGRMAKAYVSRAARTVTEAVLQIHGGIGQTWESTAHVYLRRVLLDRVALGDEAVQVQRLGETLRSQRPAS